MSEFFDELSTAARPHVHPVLVANGDGDLPFCLPLDLLVEDREVIRALVALPEGEERRQYAIEALKIGILALRHVGGQASADMIQRESTRLVREMQQTLQQHLQMVHSRMADSLRDYFDPESGRFNERVQRLIGQDGELARLLRGQIDGDNSQLARTLVAHVGRDSQLMRLLDPQQSEGLLATLRKSVDDQLAVQRNHLLNEFSLNNKEGALSRLVTELTANHGDLSKDLQQKIDAVIKEFSLNEENSALSRLVRNVSQAQRTITDEFSLDSDTSCLSRLKRELREQLEATETKNRQFQEDVKVALAQIVTTRQEAQRSTRHGVAFEDAVYEFLAREAQHAGDIATPTGHSTGNIKNCKVGDCVVELGPDSAAPGAKIAVEAKEDAGFTLTRAREEIETARKNRSADWGLYVVSKRVAPSSLEPFQRFGSDLIVVWDAEDTTTDVFLKAGIITARALCFRAKQQSTAQRVDFDKVDKAILEIERRVANLDEVRKSAETIQSSSVKILERVRIDRESLEKQVSILRERVADVKNRADLTR